jgi:hypothetical protein
MKTDTKNTLYPIQLWLTSTVVIAPLLLIMTGLVNAKWNVGIETVPIFIPFGLVLSLPVLLICLLIFRIIIQEVSSQLLIKVILAVVAITGVVISFLIISGSMAFMLSLIYSGSIIIASLICKINK